MDTKTEIKEEDLFSDNVVSLNGREFFHEVVTMKKNSDNVLLEDDCEMTVKSLSPFTEYSVKQIKSETSNWEIDRKTEIEEHILVSHFGSQNEGEILPEEPLMKYSSDHEVDTNIEIKEEPWWLETENSSVCDDMKDGHFLRVKSPRLSMEAVPGASISKPPLLPAEVSGKDNLECEYQKSFVTEMSTVEEHALSEQSTKCTDQGQMYIRTFYLKQNSLIHVDKILNDCNTCAKGTSCLLHIGTQNLIHEGKKTHQCKTCFKSFKRLSNLKTHNLIHEGKKQHQCKTCDKRFTQLSHLKTHNLFHEGKKSHQCNICNKGFTQLSHLKRHTLIHEGKKPYKCKTCDKSFTQLSNLKTHNLIHEGKKPHQCKTCDKSFASFSHLKVHNLIHEGEKPHRCKTCDKSFTRLSNLKRHNLIHEGWKAP